MRIRFFLEFREQRVRETLRQQRVERSDFGAFLLAAHRPSPQAIRRRILCRLEQDHRLQARRVTCTRLRCVSECASAEPAARGAAPDEAAPERVVQGLGLAGPGHIGDRRQR